MNAAPGDWTGRRVLVTGGAGFLGANLAEALCRAGAQVTIVDAMLDGSGANPENIAALSPAPRFLRADLRVLPDGDLAALVGAQDVVFHLAAKVGHMESMSAPLADLEHNAIATLRLLEALRSANPAARIVHASTRQFYGRPRTLPVPEDHPLEPPDCNGVSKLAAEHYALLYARAHRMAVTSLRLTNCYGPRMRIRDARLNFLGAWLGAALARAGFEVWGGEQLRDLTYADDAVAALLLAATAPAAAMSGQPFNVGGFPPVKLVDLARMVVEAVGGGTTKVVPFPEERKRIDIGSYVADDRAFRAATGWRPRVDVATGLAATVAYFRPRLAAYLDPDPGPAG